jgi:hypothetical protein
MGRGVSLKRCSVCGIEKPNADFYKDRSRSDGLEYRCKKCSDELQKRITNHKLDKYRSNCAKCGESRLYLIDFHHIDPKQKLFTIGESNCSVKRTREEVNKCICLCKNCHWEFHHLYGKNPKNPSLALGEYLSK